MAAASTSTMSPLYENTRCHKYKTVFFQVSIGVEMGKIIFILLNPVLFACLNLIKISI
jgi:hypothetical protein